MASFELFCRMYLLIFFLYFLLQKARLARIQIAKATSGAAFVAKKKAAEAKLAARAAGISVDDNFKEDVFEMQHHHLLRCLEKTTVSSIIGVKSVKLPWEYMAIVLKSTYWPLSAIRD